MPPDRLPEPEPDPDELGRRVAVAIYGAATLLLLRRIGELFAAEVEPDPRRWWTDGVVSWWWTVQPGGTLGHPLGMQPGLPPEGAVTLDRFPR